MKRMLAAAALLALSCSSGQALHVRGCDGSELPLLRFPARSAPAAGIAIVLTGDGGWRAIDEGVSDVLRDHGATVGGFLTNRYFRTARTVDEVSCDLDRVITDSHAAGQPVLLVGYSRGAETIAVALPHLRSRDAVTLAALLAPSRSASMRIGLFGRAEANVAIAPASLSGAGRVLCMHGDKERDTLCEALGPNAVRVTWPGGHHFGGDYAGIGRRILEEWKR